MPEAPARLRSLLLIPALAAALLVAGCSSGPAPADDGGDGFRVESAADREDPMAGPAGVDPEARSPRDVELGSSDPGADAGADMQDEPRDDGTADTGDDTGDDPAAQDPVADQVTADLEAAARRLSERLATAADAGSGPDAGVDPGSDEDPGGAVVGRVVDAAGTGVPGVRVTLAGQAGGSRVLVGETFTGDDGSFRFTDVLGSLEVIVFPPGGSPVRHGPVTVAPDAPAVRVTIDLSDGTASADADTEPDAGTDTDPDAGTEMAGTDTDTDPGTDTDPDAGTEMAGTDTEPDAGTDTDPDAGTEMAGTDTDTEPDTGTDPDAGAEAAADPEPLLPDDVRDALADLGSRDRDAARRAIRALAATPAALAPLARMADDPRHRRAGDALVALGRSSDLRALPALARGLRSEEAWIRGAALRGLDTWGAGITADGDVRTVLTDMLAGDTDAEAFSAAWLLARDRSRNGTEWLLNRLTSDRAADRVQASQAIGRLLGRAPAFEPNAPRDDRARQAEALRRLLLGGAGDGGGR